MIRQACGPDFVGDLRKMLARRGIAVRERSEEERWNRVMAYVRKRLNYIGPITRELFPEELCDYETLVDWGEHCDSCSNPAKCPHYGYRGEIRMRKYWKGKHYASGVFVPEYYGGKCGAYLDAKKEKERDKKDAPSGSPSGGFRW
ncbi:hypothetical protein Dpep_0360 [Dethiosulfovibrio peptidovorans DSM 11002]|uniref:Uncharacterized protein n=1 Tax=Dethiosulfovibrio peptidovorans DSM 11002 TaxID=469381 RepID=D2Z3T6_9BACT|nr:hypothetical protein [Dethiosulfovibrio peptidovorans]EFC90392.1 hypothetical protein Dpep_0360 [Dethiosulfovibrio peptidovorans DSM 11002]